MPARWQHETWLEKDDQLRRATSILYQAARTGKPLSATEGARRANCSRSTWHSYVRRAVDEKWLIARTERTGRGGWMSTSRYEVVWTEDLASRLSERWRTLIALAWECLQQDVASDGEVRMWVRWAGNGGITRMSRALARQFRSRKANPNRDNEERGTPRPYGTRRYPDCAGAPARTRCNRPQPRRGIPKAPTPPPEHLWAVERSASLVGEERPAAVMAQLGRISEATGISAANLVNAYERIAAEVREDHRDPAGCRNPIRNPAAMACWRVRRWAVEGDPEPTEAIPAPAAPTGPMVDSESYCPDCGDYHAGNSGRIWERCPVALEPAGPECNVTAGAADLPLGGPGQSFGLAFRAPRPPLAFDLAPDPLPLLRLPELGQSILGDLANPTVPDDLDLAGADPAVEGRVRNAKTAGSGGDG